MSEEVDDDFIGRFCDAMKSTINDLEQTLPVISQVSCWPEHLKRCFFNHFIRKYGEDYFKIDED